MFIVQVELVALALDILALGISVTLTIEWKDIKAGACALFFAILAILTLWGLSTHVTIH